MEPKNVEIVNPVNGENLPNPEHYTGIILTGSHSAIMDHKEWSERVAAWIPSILKKEVPLLGICYGHQLLAHALGGIVNFNPRGREFGTVEIELTEAGKTNILFKKLPNKFHVHSGHTQSVIKLPEQAKILGSSKRDPNSTFFVPPSAWGVQFHPEYDEKIIAGYVKEETNLLKTEKQNPLYILSKIKPVPEAKNILKTFKKIISPL